MTPEDPLVDLHRFLWTQIQALNADLAAARQRIAELEADQVPAPDAQVT